jgi:hypothetical protein
MTRDPTPHRARRTVPLAGLAALVVVVLTWLVWPSPAGPAVATAGTDRHTVRLSAVPPRIGPISLLLDVTDAAGRPAVLDGVSVAPVMPQMGHALPPVTAVGEAPGRYRVGVTLPMSGQWEIAVTLRDRTGGDQVVVPLLVRG